MTLCTRLDNWEMIILSILMGRRSWPSESDALQIYTDIIRGVRGGWSAEYGSHWVR